MIKPMGIKGPAILLLMGMACALLMVPAQSVDGQVGNVVISGHQYYVDPGQADQGVAGNGKTIAAYLTAIGTTRHAELIFDHKTIGADTTSYTVTTAIDVSTYPQVQFVFKPGAQLAGAGNVTLTYPDSVKASASQQIYAGSGALTFTKSGTVYPEWWGVDGTSDNAQADLAYNSLTAGGRVVFSGSSYSFADKATLQSNIVTEIKPWTTITRAATESGTSLLYGLSKTNIQIIGGGTLDGNRANVTGGDYAYGILLDKCSRVLIQDIKVTGAHVNNIHLSEVSNARLVNVNVEDANENGVEMLSCNNVKVRGCYFYHNVNGGGTADLLIYTNNVDVSVSENTFLANGTNVEGSAHGIYSIGSIGVIIQSNYIANKYGYGYEVQAASSDQATIIANNYIRDCGNFTDQTGGMFVAGENNIIVGNFVTGGAIDAMLVSGSDGSVISSNILTNSGEEATSGYGIRFSGDASNRTIISANNIRDTQATKTMVSSLYLSDHPAIIIGNMIDQNEDGYSYLESVSEDQVLMGNLYGTKGAGYYWQGDRTRNAEYVADLVGNANFDRNNFRVFLVGASGGDRNLNPTGPWHAGDDVWIKNTGLTTNIIFDSTGLNQTISPGEIGYFIYNAHAGAWVKLYLGS